MEKTPEWEREGVHQDLVERCEIAVKTQEEACMAHGPCCDPDCFMWGYYKDLTDDELNGAIKIMSRLVDQNPEMGGGLFRHLVEERLDRQNAYLNAEVIDESTCLKK